MRILVILLLALLTMAGCETARAEVTTTSQAVRGKGYGNSPQEALQDALVQVVQQHRGVSVNAQQTITTTATSTSTVGDAGASASAALDDSLHKKVSTATKGGVSNYKLIDQGIGADGLHWAEIEAIFSTSSYQAPGLPSDKRRRFAVKPFATAKGSYPVSGGQIAGTDVAEALTDAIIAQLVQARKFAVLQRRDLSAYASERAIISSSVADRNERLKLGKVLGADYMLTGVITGFNASTAPKVSSLTGETLSGGDMEIALSYELMLMATQEIKWADTVTQTVRLPANRKEQTALAQAFDSVGNRIAMDLLENIYPPQVVSAAGDEVVLNMGGKSYAAGDKLAVFARGAAIVDPYTKETLGATEKQVGFVEITRVTPKQTYARPVDGCAVAAGMVCRRIAGASAQGGGKAKTDAAVTEGGGVKLPFD